MVTHTINYKYGLYFSYYYSPLLKFCFPVGSIKHGLYFIFYSILIYPIHNFRYILHLKMPHLVSYYATEKIPINTEHWPVKRWWIRIRPKTHFYLELAGSQPWELCCYFKGELWEKTCSKEKSVLCSVKTSQSFMKWCKQKQPCSCPKNVDLHGFGWKLTRLSGRWLTTKFVFWTCYNFNLAYMNCQDSFIICFLFCTQFFNFFYYEQKNTYIEKAWSI